MSTYQQHHPHTLPTANTNSRLAVREKHRGLPVQQLELQPLCGAREQLAPLRAQPREGARVWPTVLSTPASGRSRAAYSRAPRENEGRECSDYSGVRRSTEGLRSTAEFRGAAEYGGVQSLQREYVALSSAAWETRVRIPRLGVARRHASRVNGVRVRAGLEQLGDNVNLRAPPGESGALRGSTSAASRLYLYLGCLSAAFRLPLAPAPAAPRRDLHLRCALQLGSKLDHFRQS